MNRDELVQRVADLIEASHDEDDSPADFRNRARDIRDAILPQVSTVAELEALPDGCLLVDGWGAAFRTPTRSKAVERKPLTVVWQPEVTA